jgi:YhcH/YjgK/YiaL family protein
MILDTLENSGLYESVHPRFKKAFDFLRNTDLASLPVGKIELDGSNLYASVQEVTGKTPEVARVESHNRYIDIQVPISTTETMGWIAGSKLKQETEPYNADKDITFFGDKATALLHIKPFEFAVFFPADGHQPCIGEGQIKKIVIKVLL